MVAPGVTEKYKPLLDAVLRPSIASVPCDASTSAECGIPVGLVFSPCAVPVGDVPQIKGSIARCRICNAIFNFACTVELSRQSWVCALCHTVTPFPPGVREMDRPASPVVDYLLPPQDEALAQGSSRTVVLVVDTTLDNTDTLGVQECIRTATEALQPEWRVALVTFGASLSIHDLSDGPLAAADVLPYEATPEEMTKLVEPRLTSYVSQAHHAKASIVTHVASLMGSDTRGPVSTRPRCLGPALQLALVLASLTRKALGGVGHVVCVLGGPGTVGPGQAPAEGTDSALGGLLGGDVEAGYLFREATGFYAELVERAQRDGTGIDFLGGGSRAVNVALLAPVAQLTGGAIVLHEDIAEGLGATAKGALTRHVGHQGFVEVRAGPRLGVSRVVGPSLPLEEAVRRRHGLSRAASAMASAEESHGWGVFVEPAVSALPLGETLAVQAVASWLLPGGWRVWRVATVLLEVAPDASDALASVDAAVCAVLMGKMAAAEAIRAGWPHEEGLLAARRFADSTVKRLRGSFGSPTKWTGGLLGMGRQVQEWQVPGAMKALLMALYHLDRGPLLGGVAGHADEHSQLHAAMVQAGMSLGSAMVVPQLWRMLPDGSWHLSPPVDLALLPMSVLVLDHGTHIFVWLGGQAAAAAHADLLRAAALRLVDALQRGRFPPPETRVISQGHGDTRYVLSRLAPAHRDPESMHATHWPPLRDAGDDLRRALVRGVPPSDQPSFAEWCLKRGMVLSDEVDPEAVAEVLKG